MYRIEEAEVFSAKGVETRITDAVGISRYWCVFLMIYGEARHGCRLLG
jgi:hypothetical protein